MKSLFLHETGDIGQGRRKSSTKKISAEAIISLPLKSWLPILAGIRSMECCFLMLLPSPGLICKSNTNWTHSAFVAAMRVSAVIVAYNDLYSAWLMISVSHRQLYCLDEVKYSISKYRAILSKKGATNAQDFLSLHAEPSQRLS